MQRHRLFGVWWCPIKALLKRSGFGPDQLYMLGSYQNPETAAMTSLTETLRAALEEYGQSARYPHTDGMVENPDSELVRFLGATTGL